MQIVVNKGFNSMKEVQIDSKIVVIRISNTHTNQTEVKQEKIVTGV
jgi:hypothetical protein